MEGETPSVYTETYPKARKEHKCYECSRPIPVGVKYHNFKGCWDGKWDEYKTCEPCNDLRHEISKDDSDGAMPPFGHLAEWAFECGYDFPPAAESIDTTSLLTSRGLPVPEGEREMMDAARNAD